MRKYIAGAAVAAMLAGSSIAQAAPVAIEDARAGSAVSDVESLRGKNGTHLLLGLVALILLGFVLSEIMDGDDAVGLPISP